MLDKLLSLIGLKRQRSFQDSATEKSKNKCTCPICLDIIVGCVITECGHAFCEYCLNESVFYSSLCPICRELIGLDSYVPCKTLDTYISSTLNFKTNTKFISRKKDADKWLEAKKLKTSKVGTKIDVLDTEGVWCKAVIKFKIDNGGKYPLLFIHYLGWSNIYDEIICESSNRLSPLGFYSSRSNYKSRYLSNNIIEDAV